MIALVDANYKFIYVDIGCQGCLSDEAVYQNYSFYKSLRTDQLEMPVDRQLSDLSDMSDSFLNQNSRQVKMPCIIVADDAFPSSRNCRKHYPKKNKQKGYLPIVFQRQEELLKMDLEFF